MGVGGREGVCGVGVGGVLELCAGAVNLVGWKEVDFSGLDLLS